MSLFEQIAGALLSSGQTATPPPGTATGTGGIAQVIMALIASPQVGGLPGLMAKFQQAGLGQVASSWVSTGPNQPISPNAMQQVLGPDMLQKIAAMTGLQPQQAAQQIAEHLPATVDHLTPQGQIPQGNDISGQLMAMGMKYLQSRMA
jgi:uncharacterized protein YidB (DUF937 family)